MKNKIFKIVVIFICFVFSGNLFAQNDGAGEKQQQQEIGIQDKLSGYDPLISQMFAYDPQTKIVAVINKNENTIEILYHKGDFYEKSAVLLVDSTERRHDVQNIYTPQSVAIYESHVIYLASNKDSSFIRILDLKGIQTNEFHFNGAASAFSYDIANKMLYIAGDNITGYNVFAIDVKNGFEKIDISNAPLFNYTKPKKSDETKIHDPVGIGLTAIAVSVVFLALIVIVLILMGVSSTIKKVQNSMTKKHKISEEKVPNVKKSSDFNGEEFAAIAAAIYMYNEELHDEENAVLTINKVAKVYSPWSSKMHNMNIYRR